MPRDTNFATMKRNRELLMNHSSQNILVKGLFLMLSLFMMSQGIIGQERLTPVNSSLLGRGNVSFVIDCDGKYPVCAEEVVRFVTAQKVKEVNRRSYYQGQKNEYFYFQFRCGDNNYDTLYNYLSARNINASNLLNSYRYTRKNQTDTMQTYRLMKVAEIETDKWAAALDSIKVTDPIYMTYYNKYKQSQRNYTNLQNSLRRLREQMDYPYRFTLSIYRDKVKVTQPVNNSNRFRYEYKFNPTLSFGFLAPTIGTQTAYLGIMPELSLYSHFKSYNRRGPSYAKFYTRLGVFVNESNSQRRRYVYSLGGNASFENRIDRKWAIPYFGFEGGLVNERNFGNSFFVQPKLGLLIFANKNIHVFGEGGYLYATQNAQNYEAVAASLGVNMMLWQD